MRRIEKIAKDSGLSAGESRTFFSLTRAFVDELDKNPLDPFFTPEIILPMLMWLVQHCDIIGRVDTIASEFIALVAVSSPDPRRNHDSIQVASQIVTAFPVLYPDLAPRRC